MPIRSLFPADAPHRLRPAIALPDFAARVEKLRRWLRDHQQGEALQAEFLNLVFGQALGYEFERPDYRQLLLEKKTNVDRGRSFAYGFGPFLILPSYDKPSRVSLPAIPCYQ